MRHLRPGTRLPEPVGLLHRQVLAELLTLTEGTDPLGWLAEERGALCALLTLRHVLRYAVLTRGSWGAVDSARAALGAPALAREERPLLGGLVEPGAA